MVPYPKTKCHYVPESQIQRPNINSLPAGNPPNPRVQFQCQGKQHCPILFQCSLFRNFVTTKLCTRHLSIDRKNKQYDVTVCAGRRWVERAAARERQHTQKQTHTHTPGEILRFPKSHFFRLHLHERVVGSSLRDGETWPGVRFRPRCRLCNVLQRQLSNENAGGGSQRVRGR